MKDLNAYKNHLKWTELNVEECVATQQQRSTLNSTSKAPAAVGRLDYIKIMQCSVPREIFSEYA